MKGAVIQDKLTKRAKILTVIADTFEEERILEGLGYVLQHGGMIHCECEIGEFTFRLVKEDGV